MFTVFCWRYKCDTWQPNKTCQDFGRWSFGSFIKLVHSERSSDHHLHKNKAESRITQLSPATKFQHRPVLYSVYFIDCARVWLRGACDTPAAHPRSARCRLRLLPSELFSLFCSVAAYLSCGCDLKRADPHLPQL